MRIMPKKLLKPNTTLYPVPVVLITVGGEKPNIMTCNRIISCSAEPPRLAISIRPSRFTHTLIYDTGEFVVNLPTVEQARLADYLEMVTGREENKIDISGMALSPAVHVNAPLLDNCPVNIECVVEQTLEIDSHTLFIAKVEAVHASEMVLDDRGNLNIALANGIAYDNGTVRERPNHKFKVDTLRQEQRSR